MLKTNCFLLGFMGCGKSFVGQKVAQELQCKFIDLDEYIAHEAGCSIKDIFEKEGEAHFRKLESNCLKKAVDHGPAVIALGGGTPCFYSNMDWLLEHGTALFLDISPQILLERLKNETLKRPLLKGKNDETLLQFIQDKLRERRPFYDQADYILQHSPHIITQIKTIMTQKTILLLHGALGSKEQLEEIKSRLSEKYNVNLLSFRGHGGRSIGEAAFSIDLFTEDVLDFLEKKGLNQVDIFGYSMGGYVALNLAKKHPKKVGKIYTLATKFAWSPESAAKEVQMLNPEAIEAKVPAFAKALEARHAPLDWKTHLKKTADMMLALGNGAALTAADFSSIPHEVLLTVGSKDRMVSQEETESVAKLIPNGTFECINDLPHPIEKVDLDVLCKKLFQFFNRY